MLVRDPRLVLSSYARAREEITAEDLGFLQQRDLFDHLIEVSGVPPMVVWSQDILERPRATLCAMCAALRVPFYEEMLSWPPGPRPSDGVWAKHWYASVERSTGFAPYVAKAPDYPPHHQDIVDLAMPIFERLLTYRLEPPGPIENCH
jgi:hypothetical protein